MCQSFFPLTKIIIIIINYEIQNISFDISFALFKEILNIILQMIIPNNIFENSNFFHNIPLFWRIGDTLLFAHYYLLLETQLFFICFDL